MSQYRSSTGDLSRFDEPPRGGERWDRDRFERVRGGRGGGGSRDDHDHFRFQEHDRFPGGHRDIDIHEDYDRRGPRVMERERFREEERFDRPSRSRTDLFNDPTPSEVANRALAPYRRKSIVERDMEVAPKRPARPQYLRRQSSLDTFDRRPLPRYGDVEEWRPPTNIPIPLPIRERRRSPPRFHKDEYEEVRYTEREREPRRVEREEYREVEVERAKSRRRRSHSRATKSVAQSTRSSSTSSFEEIAPSRATWGKRGKTRLPKRLCKRQAVIELGYPFEEEDDFIIITRALEKEHIDEVIKFSESYKETKTTYVYEAPQENFEPPPPPPPPEVLHIPPPPPSVHSHHHAPPPPPSVHSHYHAPPPPPASVHYAQSVRSHSPPRQEFFEERIEESNHIGGPLTVLVPDEHRIVRSEREIRSERDIRDEIRQLESERRMLKYEREGDFEIIERREPRREVVRVDKDRKGRLALVRSTR
ncbi:hypothetical protein K458DRAFT_417925 [Lentithecium fluviatile CBS 122367]|uniref:DUF8035 domain-containing protein n=1 Tax=Lentithecium fluviatile CBS 122367 TaxID=1168545 RepID=A0A6G1J2A0_9PLEO|nr:hypothetical protein K458DRAFT_417925 [Lentithecium fluviatile CBS 122367]